MANRRNYYRMVGGARRRLHLRRRPPVFPSCSGALRRRARAPARDPDRAHRAEDARRPYLDLEASADDALAALQSASLCYRIAVACKANERSKLERLCRYVARPPIALERLSREGDGLVVHELERPFADGTTEFLFEPLDFLARLAALVARARSHLVRYHGVLAATARHRRLVVPSPPPAGASHADEPVRSRGRAPMSWMQRLRRVFDIDLHRCPRCGASVRVLAVITEARAIGAILEHLDTRAARAPPHAPEMGRTSKRDHGHA